MLFAFDLVLIDKDFKVVGLRELVRPFSVTRPSFRAESVIELPAHTIFRSHTEIGDQLLIDRYEARHVAATEPSMAVVPSPSEEPMTAPRFSEVEPPVVSSKAGQRE
jgi:hypothetical protein